MKVLMLGWEYPPHITGGCCTACRAMAAALVRGGTEVTFVLPWLHGDEPRHGHAPRAAEHHARHPARRCAERHAHTDLVRALRHAVASDPVDADHGEERRNGSERRHEERLEPHLLRGSGEVIPHRRDGKDRHVLVHAPDGADDLLPQRVVVP